MGATNMSGKFKT